RTADVFPLGLRPVNMPSGRKIFEDRDVPKMLDQRKNNDEFITGRLTALAIPEAISRVVLRACRSNPEERHPSVDVFGGAIREALRGGGEITTSRFEKLETEDTSPKAPPPAIPDGAGALLASLQQREVSHRRLTLIAVADDYIDLESQLQGPQGALRFRLTLMPDARLHIKGLNCFVAKAGGRTSNAVDLDGDALVKVMSADRKHAGDIHCVFGAPNGQARLFAVGTGNIAVPTSEAPHAVLLDFGESRDALLLYRARRGAR